jgi:tetratricopeptide (TPR) repeat protein
LKAEAAVQLGRVLVRLGKLDEGTTMLDLATATVARSGENVPVEIDLANTRALLADARGATEDALRISRETIAKYQRVNEVAIATTQAQLHMVLTRIGRDADAAVVLAATAATLRKYTPAGTAELCQLALRSADLLRATQTCRRDAIEVELVKGPTAPETASALQSYALARELASELQEARTLYERSARIHEQHDHRVEAAFALERAGRASLELDDHATAVRLLARSVVLAGADPAQHLSSRTTLGRAYAGAGQHAEAIRELEWAIPKLEALEPPSWTLLAAARFAFANALWRRGASGDRDRAREHARAAKAAATMSLDRSDEQDRRRMTQLIARIDAWAARR